MPFSLLNDPADLARAFAALEMVWNEIRDSVPERERDKVWRS